MITGRFSDGFRVEVGTFEENVFRVFRNTRIQSAEHTGNAHGLFFIADHQVVARQFPLFSVEGNEFCSGRFLFDDHLPSRDFVGIKKVQRVSGFVKDVVADVHKVVDGSQPDGQQTVFQPFGRLFYFDTRKRQAGITGTGFRVFDDHVNFQVVVIHFKTVGAGFYERKRVATGVLQIKGCHQVSCNTDMRHGIGTVGG